MTLELREHTFASGGMPETEGLNFFDEDRNLRFVLGMRLAHCYPCSDHEKYAVKVDDKVVGSFGTNEAPFRSSRTPRFSVTFADTKPHAIEITYSSSPAILPLLR